MNKHIKLTGQKLIIAQLTMLVTTVAISSIVSNWKGIYSVVLGGISWIIPNIYFVYKISRSKSTGNSQIWLKDVLLGETVKLLLSVALISSIMLLINVRVVAFLGGYIAVVMASIIMPFLAATKP